MPCLRNELKAQREGTSKIKRGRGLRPFFDPVWAVSRDLNSSEDEVTPRTGINDPYLASCCKKVIPLRPLYYSDVLPCDMLISISPSFLYAVSLFATTSLSPVSLGFGASSPLDGSGGRCPVILALPLNSCMLCSRTTYTVLSRHPLPDSLDDFEGFV